MVSVRGVTVIRCRAIVTVTCVAINCECLQEDIRVFEEREIDSRIIRVFEERFAY